MMFVVPELSFDIDFEDALSNECASWIKTCCRHENLTELWDGISIGFVIMKYGFSRIINERENKRQKNNVDVVLDDMKQQMLKVFDHEKSALEKMWKLESDMTKNQIIKLQEAHASELGLLKSQLEMIHRSKNQELDVLKTQLKQVHQLEIKGLNEELERLRNLRRSDVEALQAQYKSMFENEKNVLACRITDLTNIIHELKQALIVKENEIKELNERAILRYKDDEVQRLQTELISRDAKIAQLCNTNFCKGIIGENTVRDILANSFPDHALVDKSGTAAESDLHLVNKNQEFIAIECKYKNTITLDDVKKSVRDIGTLGSKYGKLFIGYIFFSLKSVNIPQKGFSFEVINGIPVLWYGTDLDQNPNATDEIVFVTKTAKLLGEIMKTRTSDSNAVHMMLNNMLQRIESNKTILKQMNDHISALTKHVNTAADNNTFVFQSLLRYLQEQGVCVIDSQSSEHTCTLCNKSFKRKCDLTKHRCAST